LEKTPVSMLLCPWAKHLMRLPLLLSGETSSNMWQLNTKAEKVFPCISHDQGILTNK